MGTGTHGEGMGQGDRGQVGKGRMAVTQVVGVCTGESRNMGRA